MDNDRLDILMGRFLDGEIEPGELRLLNAQLANDPQGRRLFDQYQSLHKLAQAEIAPLAEKGRSFESIFSSALQKSPRKGRRPLRLPAGTLRFVSGMAAGLLLAVLVQIGMRSGDAPAESGVVSVGPAAGQVAETDIENILNRAVERTVLQVIQDVDYYYYVDEAGQHWLIEGYREHTGTQLARYQDL